MKWVDDILDKYGTDKVLHFLGGFAITSACALFGLFSAGIGVVTTAVLSWVKEQYLDDEFDANDIIAALMGSGVAVVLEVISCVV